MNTSKTNCKSDVLCHNTLSTLEERYRTIIKQSNLLIFDIDIKNNKLYISNNLPMQVISEHFEITMIKQLLSFDDVHPEDIEMYESYMLQDNKDLFSDTLTYRRRTQNGNYTWVRNIRSNIFDECGKLIRTFGTVQDISTEMEAYELIKAKEEYDILTGIPTLTKFTTDVEALLTKAIDKSYVFISFDIENFRYINDLYGFKEGNHLLKFIGTILKTNICEPNLYCRMYADNFAILTEYKEGTDSALLATILLKEISKYPFALEIKPSFGICKVDSCDIAVSTLINCANLAKKTVKGNLQQHIAFYDEKQRQRRIEESDIEIEMTSALLHDEFTMYLQPKISLETNKVVGAEALVRWIHPVKGLILPNRFIPLFENNGFILKLDYYIWEQAFLTLRKWIDEGHKPHPISVNVSRLHLSNPGLVDIFIELANRYQIPSCLIELELTETIFFDKLNEISDLVDTIKKEGFTFSIDDFGSGYSSLSMLKDISVDVIKIDRGFLSKVVETKKGKVVIQYIIAMAKELNIEVVAEGVENLAQVEFLSEIGCKTVQGFFYSKPLPIDKFEDYAYDANC